MGTEIERKWVAADGVPPEVLDTPGSTTQRMRQGYVAIDGDVTVRVRVIDEQSAVLTVKAGSSLARTEVEPAITVADADALWVHTEGRRIDKVRHAVPLDGGLVAEVDVYAGELEGLFTVEVEFATVEEAEAFTAPAWFGRDVTGDPAWSNASLSRHGRPDT